MFCSKCGKEITHGNICENCGNEIGINKFVKGVKSFLFRYKKLVICAIVLVVIFSVCITLFNNRKIIKFEHYINNSKYDLAQEIYDAEKINYDFKLKSKKIIENVKNKTKNKYINEKITLEEAFAVLEEINSFNDVTALKNELESLENSRKAFKLADEYENKGEKINALVEYNKVIQEDKNYSRAREKVEKLSKEVIEELQFEVDDLVKNGEELKAIKKIQDIRNLLSDNKYVNDFTKNFIKQYLNAYISTYDNQVNEASNKIKNDGLFYVNIYTYLEPSHKTLLKISELAENIIDAEEKTILKEKTENAKKEFLDIWALTRISKIIDKYNKRVNKKFTLEEKVDLKNALQILDIYEYDYDSYSNNLLEAWFKVMEKRYSNDVTDYAVASHYVEWEIKTIIDEK